MQNQLVTESGLIALLAVFCTQRVLGSFAGEKQAPCLDNLF